MKLRLAALGGALLLAANPSFAHIEGPPPGWGDPPGGSSGQIQWNDASAFAGIAGSNVTSNGEVTLDPSSGVPLTLEPPSTGGNALTVEGLATIGYGSGQFTLSMKDTTSGTDTFGVPYFRSVTSNAVTALDIGPNGTATDGGYGVAHVDIVNTDDYNGDGSTATAFLSLQAHSGKMSVASLAIGGGSVEPLALDVNGNDVVTIDTSYDFYVNGQGSANAAIYGVGQVHLGSQVGYSPGGFLDITKNSTYSTEAAGITIGATTGTGVPEILIGTDNTNTLAYLQAGTRGASFNFPLALQPNGGGLSINKVAAVTCSGTPTASFAATNGIVTHC